MGLPAVITTDQGKEFRNKLNQELTEKFGIKHQLITAYHPQANGLDERYNQTLANSLAKYAQYKRETWDENVGEVVYSYNTAVQESTKHTPFESMFGWMAILPVDINAVGNYYPDDMLKQFDEAKEPDEEESKAKRQKMEEIVKANIEKAQMKQKLHYDRKHGAGDLYTVGSQVLKKHFRRKKRQGGKLDYLWQDPFMITATLGNGLYRLKEVNGNKVNIGIYIVYGQLIVNNFHVFLL